MLGVAGMVRVLGVAGVGGVLGVAGLVRVLGVAGVGGVLRRLGREEQHREVPGGRAGGGEPCDVHVHGGRGH